MRTVTASEANQNFSKLLSQVTRGDEVMITIRGKAAAKIVKVDANEDQVRRARALTEALDHYRKRGPIVATKGWSRDEIYDEVTGLT